MQWQLEIHYGMTTAHNIMNIGRAINAGECIYHTDGTFNLCQNDIALVGIRVAQRCDGTATLGFSVNLFESEEAIRATFNGLQACFIAVFNNLMVRSELDCEFCKSVVDILDGNKMKQFKESAKQAKRQLPDGKFMCDDGAGYKSFLKKYFPKSMKLRCLQHLGSKLLLYLT